MRRIAILSNRGYGFTQSLRLIKNQLQDRFEDVGLCVYIEDQINCSYVHKKGIINTKQKILETSDTVLCIDPSLPRKNEVPQSVKSRVLLVEPYDWIFGEQRFHHCGIKWHETVFIDGFTHVFTTSPFVEKVLHSKLKTESIKTDIVMSPFVMDIAENRKRDRQEVLFKYYPVAKGKKICAILTSGRDNKSVLNAIKVQEFKERLGADWFIVTNSHSILQSVDNEGIVATEWIGWINGIIPPWELLYYADILYSNDSFLCLSMLGAGKKAFCIDYNHNAFERFMNHRYRKMTIKTREDLLESVAISENNADFVTDVGKTYTLLNEALLGR